MTTLFTDKRSIFNPFYYVAGWQALAIGLVLMTLSALVGWLTQTWQDGLIDIHYGPEAPYWIHLVMVLSNWIILTVVMTPFAFSFTHSKIRFIDLAGTLALARFPALIAVSVGISAAPRRTAQHFVYILLNQGEPVDLQTFDILLTVVLGLMVLLSTIWLVALSFNAFRMSANIKGTRAGVSFAVAFIIAYIISKVVAVQLFLMVNPTP